MKRVYFKEVGDRVSTSEISIFAGELLKKYIEKENKKLEGEIPLKVHFGEKGNQTFIKPESYKGIIDYLKKHSIKSKFMETNVLYSGKRSNRKDHLNTAKEHGFTQLDIDIADGEKGEEYDVVDIEKTYFKKCRLGKSFSKYSSFIVISHFKGHRMAGFGGAVKQLAMGYASRAGKMDQHSTAKPVIIPLKCVKCGVCINYCPEKAISNGVFVKIDKEKCIGCAGCIAVCRKKAIIPNFLKSISKNFKEKIAEYAYGAQLNKSNIYINFALNITRGCDCEGRKMNPFMEDIGIFISDDPVAVDKACIDLASKKLGKTIFKSGLRQLTYGEEIGLGSTNYKLVNV